ncbi:glycosyltransferase family 4 protein [Aeromonas dhakensis]|uniref:glycosyltransferase family 4 protein n=1 Tax=Aeromonas dhakensis TaxID=196024 RepID=UPI00191EB4D3|nr:glycosyltransferase family 4 protein [Aeromonas dhakensis]MBL0602060.1 glycosyltransferase family 4 protein [Aeromonas dhakensis]
MNILLIVPSNDNAGPVNVVRYLTKSNNDIEFTVLCLRKKSDLIFENCKMVFVPDSVTPFLSLFWILRFLKTNQFDICHSHGFFPDVYNYVCKTLSFNGLKSISTVHNYPDEDYPMEYGRFKGFWLSKFHYFFLRKMTSVIGCSSSVSKHLYSNNIECRTIRNGVDIPGLPGSVAMHVNYDSRPVRLLFLGRLIKRKNFSELATIFLNANIDFHEKYSLAVCGNGPEFESYKNLLSPFQNIKFMGHVDNPASYISDSDILVSTSLAEGFPLSVLEAILAGKRVLLSNIEPHLELKEFLGDAIECYQLGSIKDFLDKLDILANRRIDLQSKALYLASATRMYDEYVTLYRSI